MKHKAITLGLAVIAVIVGAVLFKGYTMLDRASQTLAEDLSQSLGCKVTIGQIELTSFNTLTIANAAVYDKKLTPLLAADKVVISYSIPQLFNGGAVMEAISQVTLLTPAVNVRQDSSGKWNYADLLQEGKEGQSLFKGKLVIENGTLIAGMNQGEWQIDAVNGTMDFLDYPAVKVKLAGLRQGAKVSLDGRIDNERLTTLNLTADELFLNDYQVLYPKTAVQVLDGKAAKVSLTLQKKQGDITLIGQARLIGAAIDIDTVRAEEIQGLVTFTDKSICFFDTAAKVNQQTVKVSGKVSLDSTVPALDMLVSSPGFDLSAINPDSPVKGTVSGQIKVAGLADNPVFDGTVNLAQGEVAGYGVTKAQARIHMTDKKVSFTELEVNIFNGVIAGEGMFDVNTNQYTASLKGQNIDSALIKEAAPYLSGTGEFALQLSGQGSISNAAVQGTIALKEGLLQGVKFEELHTSFSKEDGRVTISYLNLSAEGAAAAASGWAQTDGSMLNFNLSGIGLPMSLIASFTDVPLFGEFMFNGSLTGSLAEPQVSGQFAAQDGEVFYQPFKRAEGAVILNKQELALKDISLKDGLTKHLVEGTVSLRGEKELNLRVKSERARAENLIKILSPGEKLTGNVDNELTITGPVKNFNAAGHILLTDGSFRGQLVAKAEGSYERHNGTVVIKDFVINSLNTNVMVAGQIASNQDINFDFVAHNIDLAKIQVDMPYPIAGTADFNGKLTGSVDSPDFSGELSAGYLWFNGKEVSNVAGLVYGHGSQITIPQLDFIQDKGKFHFSGAFNADSREIAGEVAVEAGQLEFLLAVFNVKTTDFSGSLNGQLKIEGTVSQPNIWVKGQMTQGQYKKFPFENIEVDVQFVNNVLTIHKFTAQQGQGLLVASGTADFKGKANVEVSGRDIDAGLFAAWYNLNVEAKGKLNFIAQETGTAGKPHTALSLEVVGGGVSNATFDSLYGLLVIDKNIIHINQLLLRKGPYRASAYGTVPLEPPKGIMLTPEEEQINVLIKLDEANLSILPMLTKEVAWASGLTQGGITVSGTRRQPSFHGHLKVSDGVIKLTSLNEPIQKVGVDIELDSGKINVKTFEGFMGQGSYHLSGSADIQGISLKNYDMTLSLDNLGINSKYFKGPVNGKFTLSEQKGRPLLAGNLIFANDTINVPGIPTMSDSSFDADLNINVIAGPKVHFYNPAMYDFFAVGKLNFAGSTQKPEASGHISAVRGTLNYLRTSFKINQGRLEFLRFAALEPVIKLKAQTKLEQTTVDLNINGSFSALDVQLKSDPPMSQSEIMSLLTLRSRFFEGQRSGAAMNYSSLGRAEAMSLLDAGLQMTFVSELEGAFRSTFGLDQFRVKRDFFDGDSAANLSGTKEGYIAEFGKYLNDRLMFTYRLGLDHYEYKTMLRYEFSRRMSITGSADSNNNKYIGIETRFRF